MPEVFNMLRIGDCDLAGKRLHIRAGKGDRDSVLPLTDYLIAQLAAYLAIREAAPTDHLLIFRGVGAKRHLISERLCRFGHQAHIETLTPHHLRHTLATLLVNQSMPIVSLQRFLGHQDINMTLIYARVHDETVKSHFAAAMTNIEAIPVPDWPTQLDSILNSDLYVPTADSVQSIRDSV